MVYWIIRRRMDCLWMIKHTTPGLLNHAKTDTVSIFNEFSVHNGFHDSVYYVAIFMKSIGIDY